MLSRSIGCMGYWLYLVYKTPIFVAVQVITNKNF